MRTLKDIREGLEQEAEAELLRYPGWDGKQRLKRAVKTVAGRTVEPRDPLFWPAGLLANALMTRVLALPEGERAVETVKRYFDRWLDKGGRLYYPDDCLSGLSLLDLYQVTGEERYRAAARKMADFLYEYPADGAGSLPYRAGKNGAEGRHIYVDGVSMISPFLIRYGSCFQDGKATDMGVRQLLNFLQYGMDGKTGLPYHGYEFESGVKYGIIGWGRAVGWLLAGLADALTALDGQRPEYSLLKQAFRRLLDKAEGYQSAEGLYAWQLEAKDGPADTSASGLILYAVARGLRSGLLIDNHRSPMRKGRDALLARTQNNQIGGALAECLGFGQYPQQYGTYPWSLGPALSLLALTEEG